MRLSRRTFCGALCSGAAATALVTNGRADDCSGTSVSVEIEKGAKHKVALSYDRKKKQWRGAFDDAGKITRFVLPLSEHAHLRAFVPKGVKRFAIVDTSAGHHHSQRVQIYDKNGGLVRALDLADMLTASEIKAAMSTRSISHMNWYEKLVRAGGNMSFTALGGRAFGVSIAKAKVI